MATESEAGKLQWWLMGILLSIALGLIGWYTKSLDTQLKTLETRIEAYAAREAQRYETLGQTSGARWERMSISETKLANLEPRVNAIENRLGTFEPRWPLVDNRLTRLESVFERFDTKLDEVSRLLRGRR